MNDFSIAAKFLFTAAMVAITAFGIGALGEVTFKMAEAAIEAQQHDQMSYGRFSRQLWSQKVPRQQLK